jgi:hypothetical protein
VNENSVIIATIAAINGKSVSFFANIFSEIWNGTVFSSVIEPVRTAIATDINKTVDVSVAYLSRSMSNEVLKILANLSKKDLFSIVPP